MCARTRGLDGVRAGENSIPRRGDIHLSGNSFYQRCAPGGREGGSSMHMVLNILWMWGRG